MFSREYRYDIFSCRSWIRYCTGAYGPEEPELKEIFTAPQSCLKEDSTEMSNIQKVWEKEKKHSWVEAHLDLITRNVVPKKCYRYPTKICFIAPGTVPTFLDKEARNAKHLRIRITIMRIRILLFTSMRIRILLLINWCESATTGLETHHGSYEPPRFHCERQRHSMASFLACDPEFWLYYVSGSGSSSQNTW